MGINLLMTTVMATALAGGCSWAHPGANPYRGDPPAALADFPMAEDTRRQLRAKMAAHRYTDVVTITRDGITGQSRYGELREMHSGHGLLCHGNVDRSAWTATHEERGLVYCVGETCVIVPTVCNNVALVTRKPDEAPLLSGADEPIDINPAAGPPPATPDEVVAQGPESGPLAFIAAEGTPFTSDSAIGGGGGAGGWPGGGGAGFPTLPGGSGPCCATGPVGPVGPVGPIGPVGPVGPVGPPVVPLTSPVPEAPIWSLLLAGLVTVGALRRRRG